MKSLIFSVSLLFLTVSALPWHKKIPNEAGKPVCEAKNVNANFDQSNITFALVVQNSRDLVSALLDMKTVASRVVADLDNNHKGWIGRYSYWSFDNTQHSLDSISTNASSLSDQINTWIDTNRQGKQICKKLQVLETIYQILSADTATKNMQIFVYVYGGAVRDMELTQKIYTLIDKLQPKIHVIQASTTPCYRNVDDPDLAFIAGLAAYSGGTYSLSGLGTSLLGLPLQHKAALLDYNLSDRCGGYQSYQFYVDSETTSLSLRIYGELQGEVKFLAPNRKDSLTPNKIYYGWLDGLYTVTPANLKSADKYLPAGVWLVEFNAYYDNTTPCGLRVDAQTDLQLYRLFSNNITADTGSNQATLWSYKNRQIIHVESSAQNTNQLSVNFAHFFHDTKSDAVFSTSIQPRSECTYQFVSEPFYTSNYAYLVKYTGSDAQGKQFQRLIPAIAAYGEDSQYPTTTTQETNDSN